MDRIPAQIQNMTDLVDVSDEDCRNKLRMDRTSFYRLCHLLQNIGGLKSSKYINVYEKVAMFLSILAHHSKNRCTVLKQFHSVLRSVLKLHYLLLVKPHPIPEDSDDARWGCLGALDGMYIDVHVLAIDKRRYRNRKGQVSLNVLTVCDMKMRFVHVLTGWEGSALDSRVLRNALNRENGLKFPKGAGFGHEVDKKKSTRGRRSWSRVEEDALIHCLTDIVNDGWKADNGFKARFLRELEKGMRRILPATDIVANPHINSKIHVWKKEYSVLSDLLFKSGIGWNSTTSMINVEDGGVWDACKRADPLLKGIRYKTWPYYSYWPEIFGKDRATGENAMEPIDLVNDILRSGHGDQEGDTGEKYCPINPLNNNEAENNSICKPEGSGKLPASKGVKRKNRDNEVNSLVESLGAFMKQSHETFGDIAKGLGSCDDFFLITVG
ncbi:hypothetical protein ACS0TY_029521 [Phlomoides rotata]